MRVHTKTMEFGASCPSMSSDIRNPDGHPLRHLSVEDTSSWHELAVAWLQNEILRLRAAGVVALGVLSHHTPAMLGTSHPRFVRLITLLRFRFCTTA